MVIFYILACNDNICHESRFKIVTLSLMLGSTLVSHFTTHMPEIMQLSYSLQILITVKGLKNEIELRTIIIQKIQKVSCTSSVYTVQSPTPSVPRI